MAKSLITHALLIGAAAAAVALAPTAGADRPGCDGSGCSDPGPAPDPQRGAAPGRDGYFTPSLQKGWTNEAQWARPDAPAGSNPFGKGPRPPVIALD